MKLTMRRILYTLAFLPLFALAQEDVIVTDSTTNSTVTSKTETTLNSPPPSAITPTINNYSNDLCTVGVAGAVQTQILGISAGATVRDMNCEKLKNAKTLYDMGMKVAAVSVMCQDKRVFDAMLMAGTPCPYNGMIGEEARAAWETNTEAEAPEEEMSNGKKTAIGGAGVVSLLLLLLL